MYHHLTMRVSVLCLLSFACVMVCGNGGSDYIEIFAHRGASGESSVNE
jgi:hypothetical protein